MDLQKESEDHRRDPQDKLWSVYISETAHADKALAENWKGEMDGILIYAGLFSAILTAFIIQTYPTLQQNPADVTIALLMEISQQLANSSVQTQASSANNIPFQPRSWVLRVNAYWFLSLAFSLACGLAATLVHQLARHYQQSVESHSIPHKRARVRAYMKEGVERFGVVGVVNTIPTLLHISVLLFMIGLFELLLSINSVIAYLTLGVVIIFVGLYLALTLLPTLCQSCPYQTPLSAACWRTLVALRLIRFHNNRDSASGNESLPQYRAHLDAPAIESRVYPDALANKSLSRYQAKLAIEPSPARQVRDQKAIQWMLESFTEDNDFERIIAGIPDFLVSQDDNPGIALWERFQCENIELGTRITKLLVTCQSGGVLSETARHKRAQTCLNAIWSLTERALLGTFQAPKISLWSVSQANLAAIAALKHDKAPAIAIYVSCTIAIVSCQVLERWSGGEIGLLERLKVLELLDVYKFLRPLSHLRKKQELELKHQRLGSVQELKCDSKELEQELEVLKQDGPFGIFISFISSLLDVKILTTSSGLPLASKTLDVIIPRFPDSSPRKHTQELLLKCLHRVVSDGKPRDRRGSGQSEDHWAPPNESLTLDHAVSPNFGSGTKLPVFLIDRFLADVVHTFKEPTVLEKAKKLIISYQTYSDSDVVGKALSTIENKITSDRQCSERNP